MVLAINILTIKPAFDRFLRHRVPVEDGSHLPPPVSGQCLPRNAVRAQPHLALWADRRGTAADGLQKGRERDADLSHARRVLQGRAIHGQLQLTRYAKDQLNN